LVGRTVALAFFIITVMVRKDAKYYRIGLVANEKSTGDAWGLRLEAPRGATTSEVKRKTQNLTYHSEAY
jgi:hypothetical protein